ncbi:uncharacterized protein LOC141665838 [Apium graveolens]|uniref:uncharacterized protein LOC141665838 n=1 Tax=Apium graveolens TaxID=4045 RepID=UPI003D796424
MTDKGKTRVTDDMGTGGNVEYSTDSTEYANSEEERMAANSTDEEEIKWSVFDEKSEMGHPKFELGQLFASTKVFREAVKKQTIVERRPVVQKRNYGSRVKFVCSNGCKCNIYTNKMQRMNPTWPLQAFLEKVVNDWGRHVSIYAIARAKRKALQTINGKHVEQYSRVWDYANALLKALPDSTVLVMTEDAGGAEEGPYGGQLLEAIGTYANDGMYPLAWAVVEAKNNQRWNWFLKNMWKERKGIDVRMILWKAARATTEYTFKKHMDELQKLSKKCYDWLSEKPKTQWSRSAFRLTPKSDQFVNNQCEVFNSTIGKYRDLPILSMLQSIHIDVMKRIQKRRDKMLNSYALNPICPNALRILNNVTSLRNLELARKKRESRLKQKPVWKL